MRRIIVISVGIALLLAVAVVEWRSHQRTGYGFTLTRCGDETIRISWGTPSGVNISPTSSMRFPLGYYLESEIAAEVPRLSSLPDVWMHDLEPESMGSAVPASFVNPLNDDAFDQMLEMIRLRNGGNINAERMTRIAARNYIYLGFVVTSDKNVLLLKAALADRASVPLDRNITTSGGVLYRIAPGVEKYLAKDPNDMDELREVRHAIPVMFELLNRNAGHPCNAMHVLYLDGHVERIPFGDKFPATQTFVEAFPPPQPSH